MDRSRHLEPSPDTVEVHVRNCLDKLGVNDGANADVNRRVLAVLRYLGVHAT